MYLGSNSFNLSITLYTFWILLPFSGGNISKEKSGTLTIPYQINDFHILIIFDANVANILRNSLHLRSLI